MNGLTKKLSLCIGALAVCMTSWTLAKDQILEDNQNDGINPSLEVKIRTPINATYTKNHVVLGVTFENVSDKPIRLLRVFKPTPAFFKINSLMNRVNTLVVVPTPEIEPKAQVKLSQADSLKYLELEAGESFTAPVDVSELLPPNLKEGLYEISLIYHNEYGVNCFKDTKTTEGVWISIIEEPMEEVAGSISKEKALEIAKKAFAGKTDLKVSIRSTATQFIVTFGGPPKPAPPGVRRTGGDFAAQVYINRLTGVIEKILGS